MISSTDENGFVTTYSYNIYGSPTQITYADGSTERFVYYLCGWLKQKWQADGTSVYYTYDPKGRLIKESFLDKNGSVFKEEDYHYKGALLQFKKDAMGLITTYNYDGAGRKIEEKIGELKINKYAYDDFGNIIRIEREEQQEIYQYDYLNQMLAKTLQDMQGNIYAKETYAYDMQGHQIQKSVWQALDKIAHIRSEYDSHNRLLWQENPLGQRKTWQYNSHHNNGLGQRVECRTIHDALARPIREADDVFHRLVRQDVYEGEKQLSCTHFDYDAKGHFAKQHSLVMAEGQSIREYSVLRHYNSRGLVESETEMPQGKITRFYYDAIGRLSRKEKADSVNLYYTYDALGRLQTLTSSDKTVAYTYHYDLHDNLIQVEDPIHQQIQNRFFDKWNRLEREEIALGIFVSYTYDSLDRLTHMTLPDGSSISYLYDAFHLKKMQRFNREGLLIYEIECHAYDLRGNLLKSSSPAGSIIYTYDLLRQAVNIQTPYWESQLKHFDLVGNLSHMNQKDPSGILDGQFGYDRFNHLISESMDASNQYTYDSIGNCLKKNQTNYDVNSLNQLENDGEAQYCYDANGNLKMQSSPHILYTYDALNLLISCEKEGHLTTFVYDCFGRCLQITTHSETKQLFYQGDQEIGSLINGNIQEFRLVHPEKNYDLTFAIELKEETFFPVQDFKGNICALRTKEGHLAEWYRYSAFGSKTIKGNRQKSLDNPWQFANRREVIDLVLFAQRFYNPRLMRWQTTDPLGFEDGLNLYTYVHNRPFYYKDPDGQFAFVIPLVMGAFGTGGLVLSGPTIGAIAGALIGATLGWGMYEAYQWAEFN